MPEERIVEAAQLETGPRGELAAQPVDGVGPHQIDEGRPRKQTVLDRLGPRRRRRKADPLAVEGCCLVEGEAALVKANVDHGPGGDAQTAVPDGEGFPAAQKADLSHELGGIASPTLRHGAPAEEGDARSAVHCSDLADARSRAGGVPVLDMVADTAVV